MFLRSLKKTIVFSVVAVMCYGLFVSCENPFAANLGAKVDIEPPTITVTSPVSGDLLQGIARFEGNATAYRELKNIEVRLLSYQDDLGYTKSKGWSSSGVVKIGNDPTNKNWYFDLDTRAFGDGNLKMQFRASDVNLSGYTVELVYVVKNKPSTINLAQPSDTELKNGETPQIQTDTDILGQVIDRRGIKPGYPRIKIWPATEAIEPDDDHASYGYVQLFLSGFDDPNKDRDGGNDYLNKDWGYYADRNEMTVVRVANFTFRLAKYTIDPITRQVKYTLDGSKFVGMDPGKYNFRIMSIETYTYNDPKDEHYTWPRPPEGDEEELEAYYPAENSYYSMDLVTEGVLPVITLDNSDKSIAQLEEVPNIYITKPAEEKTIKTTKNAFRLRINAAHISAPIESATLRVEHGTDAVRTLIWNGDGGTSGIEKEAGNQQAGRIYEYTGKEGVDGFSSSPVPYSLIVEAKAQGLTTTTRYTVLLDASSPTVALKQPTPIMGYVDPPPAAGTESLVANGGRYNDTPYTVNGNIQALISRSAAPRVIVSEKWIVELDTGTGHLTNSGTVLSKLKDYFADPTPANYKFYADIKDGILTDGQLMQGLIQPAKTAATDPLRLSNDYHLKFNTLKQNGTVNEWDGKDLWLYVIAENNLHNLGFYMQKLHVNDSTDLPKLDVGLDGGILNQDGLLFPNTNNVLGKSESIGLSITDDDGVRLSSVASESGVDVKLTNLYGTQRTVTIPVVKNGVITVGTDTYTTVTNSSRSWTGSLTQQIMANALYTTTPRPTNLADGAYKLEITVKDDTRVKVELDGNRPGDRPAVAKTTAPETFYFAVRSDEPIVEIESPAAGETVSKVAVPIKGTVKSAFHSLTSMNIIFTPNVIQAGGSYSNNPSPPQTVTIHPNPTYANGVYTHTWSYPDNVNFAPDTPAITISTRKIEVSTIDGMGYPGSSEIVMSLDNIPPVISLNTFNYDRPKQRAGAYIDEYVVNGKVPFTVNVFDPSGVKNIGWWIQDSETAPTWANTANAPALAAGVGGICGRFTVDSTGNYTRVLNTTTNSGLIDKTEYHLFVIAEDNSDNKSVGTRLQSFRVDQDSDYPVLDAVTPQSSGGNTVFVNTITSGGLRIEGAFSDDDGFMESSFTNAGTQGDNNLAYVQIRFPNNATVPPTSWGNWITINSSTGSIKLGAGGDVEFMYNAPITGTTYPGQYLSTDGAKHYQIRLTDEAAAGNGNPPNYGKNPTGTPIPATPTPPTLLVVRKIFPSDTGSYSFTKKNIPPAVYFDNYDPTTGHLNYRADRPTYKDANSMVADLKTGYVNDNYLDESSVTITYTSNGNQGYESQTLTKDTVKSDNNNYYWDIASPSTLATYLTTHFGNGKSGTHTITIVASDKVGGTTRVEWTFAKDGEGPVVSGPSGKTIKDETTVEGTLYDDLSPIWTLPLVSGNASQTFSYAFYQGVTPGPLQTDGVITPGDVNDTRRANWKLTIPTTLPDGDCVLRIVAKDIIGNESSTDFTFTLDRNAPLVSPVNLLRVGGGQIGTQKTMSENERVFSASEVTPPENPVFILSGLVYERNLTELSAAINPGGGGATIVRELKGKDPITEAFFDTWVKTGTGSYPSTTANFRIRRATDIERTTHLTDTTSEIYIKSDGDFGSTGHLYVWELVVDRDTVGALFTANGTLGELRSITVVARDIASRSSVRENWRFYLDNEKPTVEFTNANWSTAGAGTGTGQYTPTSFENLSLQGTIADDTSIKSLKFTIAKWINTGAYAEGGWRYYTSGTWSGTAANGNYNDSSWVELLSGTPGKNTTWTLGNAYDYYGNALKDDGRYKIDFYFTDYSIAAIGAGNPGTKSVEIYIDNTPPTIVWESVQKEYYRSDALTFTLKASDLNSIQTPTFVLSGGTAKNANITTEPTGNPPANKFEVSIDSGDVTSGQRYTLVLTVKDGAGNVAVNDNTLTFMVDDTAPTIAVTHGSGYGTGMAMVGRVNFQGNFTKSGSLSPVSRVAFLATSGNSLGLTVPVASTIQSDIKGKDSAYIDNYLKTAGWVFNPNNAPGSFPFLTSDGTTTGTKLMEIYDGLASAKLLLYETREFGSVNSRYLKNENGSLPATLDFDGVNNKVPSGATGHIMPLYFLAIDEAGNVNILEQNYYIYPKGDLPRITAINNPNDKAPVAERLMNGTIRISGTAVDNVRVKNVWFRVLDGTTPRTDLKIPVWNQETWDPLYELVDTRYYQSQTPPVSKTLYGGSSSPGWYMANGGGSKSVAWWAYINNAGELDPTGTNLERNITIEVIAEDTRLNSDGETYQTADGLFPETANKVAAKVVRGAPRFGKEWVKLGPGDAPFGEAGVWSDIEDINITKRSAYVLVVEHEMGVGSIRWNRVGDTAVNLLDESENSYSKTTYVTNLNGMNAATPIGPGIAVKAVPRTTITGPNYTVPAGSANERTFIIWKTGTAVPTFSSAPSPVLTTEDNVRYTKFTADAGTTITLNGAELMKMTSLGVFEWVVVADLYTTLLSGYQTSAEWYPLNITASEISKSVPLSVSYFAQIPVDNIAPSAAYTHNTNLVGPGTTFGGEAGDGGTVKGLDRIVMWFSRLEGGVETFIPWNDKSSSPANFEGTTSVGMTLTERNATGITNLPTVAAFAGFRMPKVYDSTAVSGNFSSIVIDRHDPRGEQKHHGFINKKMGFAPGGSMGTNWYVELPSTDITSGRVTAHYVVYDLAGNATYHSQKIMILNGKPQISNITLATDIRGGTGLGLAGALVGTGTNTNNLANGTANINNLTTPTALIGGAKGGDGIVKRIRDRFIARITNNNKTASSPDSEMGISDEISIDTINRLNNYDVVYDDTFTVRNNLLAARVDTLIDQSSGKTRSFRFEYVQNAKAIDGSALRSGTGIRAGRMYIINDPGSALFPWNVLGVQGETPRRGLAFLALENGDVAIPEWNATFGAPSVWELNGSYYANANSLVRTFPNAQNNLRLSDVTYPNNVTDGKFAEFVYQSGAFGNNLIVDFNPQTNANAALSDFNTDGRPKAYPFPSVVNGAQTPVAAHSLFIVRVFDGDEADLFGDFALLSIRVNNTDKTKPYAQLYDLNPKAEDGIAVGMGENRAKGGLSTATGAKSGHVEPRTGTSLTSGEMGGAASANRATIQQPFADTGAYFTVDTVSGEVIVRGYAEDDKRVYSVELSFSGTGITTQTVTILSQLATGSEINADKFFLQVPNNANTNNRVEFTETVDLNRHRVEWSYLWPTETVPSNILVGDVTVRAIAYNTNTATPRATSDPTPRTGITATNQNTYDYFNPDFPVSGTKANTTAGLGEYHRYNQIDVNIRPYISGILRDTTAHNERSRQGWYMLRRGETAVVSGFNLGSATAGYATAISLSTATPSTTNVTAPTDFGLTGTPAVARYRQFTVNTDQATGDGMVTLTVMNTRGNFPAVNTCADKVTDNRPKFVQPWNVEYRLDKEEESRLWDDFTAVHIWQSNGNTGGTDNGVFVSTDNWVVMNPAMSIDPSDGTLYASHNEGGFLGGTSQDNSNMGRLFSSTNTGGSATALMRFREPVIQSDVYHSPGGNTIGAATWYVTSLIGQSNSWSGGRGFRAFGGIYIYGPEGGQINLSTGAETFYGTNPDLTNHYYLAESAWYNSCTTSPTGPNLETNSQIYPPQTDQFMNPHIVTYIPPSGTAQEHIHVSYYDSKDGSIKYRYNRRGAAGRIDNSEELGNNTKNPRIDDVNDTNPSVTALLNYIPKAWTNLDGGFDKNDTVQATTATSATGTLPGTSIAENARVVNFLNTTARPRTAKTDAQGTGFSGNNTGEHNAIAVTKDGYPVIAYFDATSQKLKLAISRTVNPIEAIQWQILDSIIPGSNQIGTGEYVSIAIDGSDNIHIAALNASSGNLVYATGKLTPPTTAGTTGGTGTYTASGGSLAIVTVQVVDSIGTVGRWCNISLDAQGRPWIAYQDAGYIGAKDGVKLAYLNTTRFTKGKVNNIIPAYNDADQGEDIDVYGKSVLGWETMHVPTNFKVENPSTGTGEHGRIGLENFPTIRNTGATKSTGIPRFAAVSYLGTDTATGQQKYRIAYYVK